MTPLAGFLVVALTAFASWLITGFVRRLAVRRAILDLPNERSAHTAPTPRGGGLAIVLTVSSAVALLGVYGLLDTRIVLALLGGGLAVALAGWLDDLRALPAITRVVVHFAAAIWAVAWLGGVDGIRVGDSWLGLSYIGNVLAVIGIVWSINLYNFMDGIDGIAAGEAVIVALSGGTLILALGDVGLGLSACALGGASLGFLLWNWPPARIFMGDVGSGFIGFLFAALALISETRGSLPLVAWCVLLGAFVVDSTLTLLRRALRGERLYRAHALHAYQRMARWFGGHRPVTLAVIGIDIVLASTVALVIRDPDHLGLAAAAMFLSLFVMYMSVERLAPMWRGRAAVEPTPRPAASRAPRADNTEDLDHTSWKGKVK